MCHSLLLVMFLKIIQMLLNATFKLQKLKIIFDITFDSIFIILKNRYLKNYILLILT